MSTTYTSTMSEPPAANLSPKDLCKLTNELNEVTDPRMLGIQLGIVSSDVTRILQDANNTTEKRKLGILDHWLNNDLKASWYTVVKALKKMDHKRLAERLAKTYCSQEAKGTIRWSALLYLETTIILD